MGVKKHLGRAVEETWLCSQQLDFGLIQITGPLNVNSLMLALWRVYVLDYRYDTAWHSALPVCDPLL